MNPILHDFSLPLRSQRLIIREARAGDGAAINAAIVESMNDLRLWMPWAKSTPTPDETEEWVRSAQAKFLQREELPMTIWRTETGEFVGNCGLHNIDWGVPKFEIGYWIRSSHSGQGLMTEAVNAVAEFCRTQLGARRVQICMDDTNTRSWKVAERSGFRLESISKNEGRNTQGELRDMRTYTKIYDEQGVQQ